MAIKIRTVPIASARPRPMTLFLRLPLLKTLPLLALLASSLATGCAHLPAYERGQLAHPSMTTSDLARASEEHVRAVQEGAAGGGFSAGGGCGCN
jgi:hypothetical protein